MKEIIDLQATMVATKAELLHRLDMLTERVKVIGSRDVKPNQEPQEEFTLEMLRRIMDSLDELYATHAIEQEQSADKETREFHRLRARELLTQHYAVSQAVFERQQRGDA